MNIRFEHSPSEVSRMNTEELRRAFLVESLAKHDELNSLYSHYDRIIVGVAKPDSKSISLLPDPELRATYFLERREIGIINVGGPGKIKADGEWHTLEKLSCLYLGKGIR